MKSARRNLIFLLITLSFVLSDGCSSGKTGFPAEGFHQSPFGKRVFVFDPGMEPGKVQGVIDSISDMLVTRQSEFSTERFALLFKPGTYHLDLRVGYYMQVAGLGSSPEETVIVGAVRSNSTRPGGGHVLTNFWRSVENLTVVPYPDSTNVWGVSQAAPMRRVHIKGNLKLFDNGYSSGGFLSDSRIDGEVIFGSQQQWFSRNSSWSGCSGGAWNILAVGVEGAPDTNWPEGPYTSLNEVPVSREKPFITWKKGTYILEVPGIRVHSIGTSWEGDSYEGKRMTFKDFYIAFPGIDDADALNRALKKGKNLLFTPGIYALDAPLLIHQPHTLLLGLGMANLVPENGNPAIVTDDVNGLVIGGLLVDAALPASQVLLRVGHKDSEGNHQEDPIWIFDLFFRVGGPFEGSSGTCLEINSSDVFLDHTWLWRADHGNGVGWDKNTSGHGLVVNGDRVTAYGLFNEHHQDYQTVWNGNDGKVYLYQSEMPYDPPTVDSWRHDDTGGFASYKVSSRVSSHEAWGVGVYCVFYEAPVVVETAIETPASIEPFIHHKFTFWLNGNEESLIRHVINDKGESVHKLNRRTNLD